MRGSEKKQNRKKAQTKWAKDGEQVTATDPSAEGNHRRGVQLQTVNSTGKLTAVVSFLAYSFANAQTRPGDVLRIHPVKEKPSSPGMARIAMQDLGCEFFRLRVA